MKTAHSKKRKKIIISRFNSPLLSSYYYHRINSLSKSNTLSLLKSQSCFTGKMYFSTFFKQNKEAWFKNKNLPRYYIVTVNRIRANHYSLAASLARVNITENSKCSCGYEIEDVNHVTWQCSNYDLQRRELLKKNKNAQNVPTL